MTAHIQNLNQIFVQIQRAKQFNTNISKTSHAKLLHQVVDTFKGILYSLNKMQ